MTEPNQIEPTAEKTAMDLPNADQARSGVNEKLLKLYFLSNVLVPSVLLLGASRWGRPWTFF
ncbi:MAG: hypothetical protein GY822_03985 [Deltaproteobacteria bacterium]|nr:hypothetical protein [Deltaproteobacteria bacterium]